MSNTESPSAATGYVSSFVVAYQVEGVTPEQATRIQAAVQRALETNVPELIGAAAEAPVIRSGWKGPRVHDRAVLGVRVEARQHAPEEYDVR